MWFCAIDFFSVIFTVVYSEGSICITPSIIIDGNATRTDRDIIPPHSCAAMFAFVWTLELDCIKKLEIELEIDIKSENERKFV